MSVAVRESSPFRGVLPGAVAACVLAAIVTSVCVILSAEPRENGAILATFEVFAFSFLPAMIWLLGDRRMVPIFEAICVSYGAHFGLTALLEPNLYTSTLGVTVFSDDELEGALHAVVLGLIAMLVPYLLLNRPGVLRAVPALDLPLSRSRLSFYLPGAVLIGLVLTAAHASAIGPSADSPFWALMYVLINQVNVAMALLCYFVLGTRNPPKHYAVLLALGLIGSILIGFTTSSLEAIFLGIFIFGTVGLQFRRNIVFVIMGVLVVAFLILQPVKIAYRTILDNAPVAYDLSDRLGLFIDTTVSFVQKLGQSSDTDTPDTTTQSDALQGARTSLLRLDFIHEFALVRMYTPSYIPYLNGSTYSYFFVGWIPRLFWPDKPSPLAENNQLVLSYGILSEQSAQKTTASLGLLPEAYANFGDLGILVFMALQGTIFAMVRRVFCGSASIGAQSVALSVLFFLVNGVGGITSVLYGGLLQNLAANLALLWLLAGIRPTFDFGQALGSVMSRLVTTRTAPIEGR